MPLPDLRLCCAIHEPCEQPQPLPPPHAAQQHREAQKHFSAALSHRHYIARRELDDDTRDAARSGVDEGSRNIFLPDDASLFSTTTTAGAPRSRRPRV